MRVDDVTFPGIVIWENGTLRVDQHLHVLTFSGHKVDISKANCSKVTQHVFIDN